jgi:Mg-chelatase subunit ChlD
MARRHKYRKPRFRPFRPGLPAKAPRLMLLVGLILSVGAHLGLAWSLQDQTFGAYDPAVFEDDGPPVRIKRATFDQILSDAGGGDTPQDTAPSADELAQTLMAEVETDSSDPFDPELELRAVPEPIVRPEAAAAPAAADVVDLDNLLAGFIDAPDEAGFDESSQFDAQRAAGPDSGDLAGQLLSDLAAADGGLPGGGVIGGVGFGSTGPGNPSAPGTPGPPGGGGPAGPGTGWLSGGNADPGQSTATPAGRSSGGGLDFLGFAEIDPEDFEPPERLDNDFDYRVSRYEPGGTKAANAAAAPGDDGYFRVQITGKRSLRKLATMPKDVVFMVDTSRSIPQRTIDQIVAGIQQSIRTMNRGDRFNLVFFNDQVRFFAAEPVEASRENLDRAERWVRNVRARGQTDVNLALRQLLRRDLEPGRVYELILISDGRPTLGVLDTRELINLITRENDLAASIYCVGIGRGQDNRLLDFLAYRNKGFSISIDSRRDIAAEMTALMSRLRYPIVQDVQVRFAGQGMDEVYPLTLPNIHQGESFEVFGRFDEPGPFTVQITGRSAGNAVDLTFRADLRQAEAADRAVAEGWAFWKLHHLYSEIIRLGERADLLAAIRQLRQRYRLETLY